MTNQKSIDSPSISGQFGWERIGSSSDQLAVPVIIRSNELRYSPVRIVEQEIIKKYDNIPQSVFHCITLKSFYITPAEAKLLNAINFNHCNNRYGEVFFSIKDLIISAADVKELSRYLNISHNVFSNDLMKSASRLGILRITVDPHNSTYTCLVPYVCKIYNGKPERFVPAKLVEPYVVNSNNNVKAVPTDWDLTYLKMLSIYCENNSQTYITRENLIVLLEGLVYSKTNTPIIYEDWRLQTQTPTPTQTPTWQAQ